LEKNKKNILKVALTIFCIILVVALYVTTCQTVSADVGNNNRYEQTSTSSSSSGGSSGLANLIIWLLFDAVGPIPGLIIIVLIIFFYFKWKKSGKLEQIKSGINNATTFNNTPAIAEQIRVIDPYFSQDAFIGWAREVFMKIQQAWSTRDWRPIRPFESNELFSQHSAQLQEYINNNKINVVEKININYCALKEFRQDGDKEVLVVELHAIMRDYVIDATTRNVLESDPNKDWSMKYLLTFNRKAGVKTNPGTSNKSTTNCPNCGAVTDITSAGQCKYCDSVITTGEHDWVLSDIRSIK
jgi:hypothetical protein